MIRPLTLVTLCAAAGAGLYLYQVKHSVSELDRQLRDINRRTEQARERTQVLRAEWALLNEPDRLRQVAQRYLPLDAMTPTQFVRLSEMERRLPAARQFAGPPSLFAPTEPPGDGSAAPMAIAAGTPRERPAGLVIAAAAVPAVAAAAAAPAVVEAPVAASPAPAAAAPEPASPAAQTLAAVDPQRLDPPRAQPRQAEAPAPRPAPRAAAPAPRPAAPAPAVQPAVHVQRRPPAPPAAQTVAANVTRPVVTSSLGVTALSGAPTLAPPVPIARAAAATLPPGMSR